MSFETMAMKGMVPHVQEEVRLADLQHQERRPRRVERQLQEHLAQPGHHERHLRREALEVEVRREEDEQRQVGHHHAEEHARAHRARG